MREFIKNHWLRLKLRVLMRVFGSGEITGLNGKTDWDKANFDTVLMHWIMKEPLRKLIRMLPDVPDRWIDNLTGSQKLLYQIAKECWYDCDGSGERKEKMWKPFLYFLVIWHNDEMTEFADRIFYETLRRRDEFFIPVARLDPKNWYMDQNPGLPVDERGRCNGRRMTIGMEDPAVRFDTLTDNEKIVLLERPSRSFVCLRDDAGKPMYTLFNRFEHHPENGGGYGYTIAGRTGSLYDATIKAEEIENGGI